MFEYVYWLALGGVGAAIFGVSAMLWWRHTCPTSPLRYVSLFGAGLLILLPIQVMQVVLKKVSATPESIGLGDVAVVGLAGVAELGLLVAVLGIAWRLDCRYQDVGCRKGHTHPGYPRYRGTKERRYRKVRGAEERRHQEVMSLVREIQDRIDRR